MSGQPVVVKGICFYAEDALSCAPHAQLRADALALAFANVVESQLAAIGAANPAAAEALRDRVCVVDPNVAFLCVKSRRAALGPVDDLARAWVICVPIADFSIEQPEGGEHWTLLVLQRRPGTEGGWFEPVHIDSAPAGGGERSRNAAWAFEAANTFVTFLNETEFREAQARDELKQRAVPTLFDALAPAPAGRPALSLSAADVRLLRNTPRQMNATDCGVFAALAVRLVFQLVGRVVAGSMAGQAVVTPSFGLEKEGIFVATAAPGFTYGFDQLEASQFKAVLHKQMTAALNHQK